MEKLSEVDEERRGRLELATRRRITETKLDEARAEMAEVHTTTEKMEPATP